VENQVIKLSRYGAKIALEQEAKVLKELKCDSGCIPRWVGSDDLKVVIGGIPVVLPALVTEPRGISIGMMLATLNRNATCDALLAIGQKLVDALSFIHERGFHHHDVSPKNIMFNNRTQEAFLIDFGLAARDTDSLKGFRGTTLYAHSFIFGQYPRKLWKSEPKYDYTSLALSMAVLSKGGKCPWKQFDPRYLDDIEDWVTERSRTAWTCLEDGGFAEGDWKNWCEDS
jgi:serine/threonine protein kinase